MTIADFVRTYPHIETDLFLEHVLHKPREFLFLHPNHRLTRIQSNRLTRMVARRLQGEPVAYILGYKDFYGLRFKVNKNVLIPRPETEWLVDSVTKVVIARSQGLYLDDEAIFPRDRLPHRSYALTARNDSEIRILDLGTGSGCIAITLAKLLPQSAIRNPQIIASDVSPAALSVAHANAKTILGKKSNSLNYQTIRFVRSNLFEKIRGTYDIIVANLPYVPKKVYRQQYRNLKFEPKGALIDPKKDFDLYRKFFAQLPGYTHEKSIIYLEIDPLARTTITEAAKKYLSGWKVKFYQDFRGLWRYAVIAQSIV